MEEQIVTAYKEGLSVPEIAETFGVEEITVKLVLSKLSKEYREKLKEKVEEISDEEKLEMLDIIKSIARSQQFDNPGVALKAAQFVFNEKKGRNQKLPDKVRNPINILVFNEELVKARERLAQMQKALLETSQEKMVVDV